MSRTPTPPFKQHVAQNIKAIFHAAGNLTRSDDARDIVDSIRSIEMWDAMTHRRAYDSVVEEYPDGEEGFQRDFQRAVYNVTDAEKVDSTDPACRYFLRECVQAAARSLGDDPVLLRDRERRSELNALYYRAYKTALKNARELRALPVIASIQDHAEPLPDTFFHDNELWKTNSLHSTQAQAPEIASEQHVPSTKKLPRLSRKVRKPV